MKNNRFKGNHVTGTVCAAVMLIGASTMLFQGFTQAAAAAEYNKTNKVPTTYVSDAKQFSGTTAPRSLPAGYKKANYTVGAIDLPYYKNQTPSKKDMTKESAAELAAQYLWQVYDVSLGGQTIEMGYSAPTDNIPRSEWTADIEMKGQSFRNGYRVDSFEVGMDSVTGELLSINMDRTLQAQVKAGPDASLDQGKYETAAKKLAVKYNIVHSDIESMNCTGQGASFPAHTDIGTYGDPDISFEIHGKNGEVALMTISRYDEVLKGIGYNGSYQYDKMRAEKQAKETQPKTKAAGTSGGGNQTPSIMAETGK